MPRKYSCANRPKIGRDLPRRKNNLRSRYESKRKAWREVAISLGKDVCSKCGYNKCFAAIEFHHRDPSTKVTGIGIMFSQPITAARLAELEKCDALCANCHREIHNP
jgi:hypothetical protein